MQLISWFAEGGLYMWFVLFGSLIALAVTFGGIGVCNDSNKRVCLKVIIFVSLLPIIIGGLGYYHGYTTLMSVVPMVDPPFKKEIFEEGMSYAKIPAVFGGIVTFVLLILGLVGLRFCKK